jgi:hypothetical protein
VVVALLLDPAPALLLVAATNRGSGHTDIDRRLSQIDSAIDPTIAHGRGKAAMALADQQRNNRGLEPHGHLGGAVSSSF